MSQSGWVHLDVTRVQRVRDKSLLLLLEDGREVWVPKSQVSDAETYAEGDEDATVSVREWFALKAGIA